MATSITSGKEALESIQKMSESDVDLASLLSVLDLTDGTEKNLRLVRENGSLYLFGSVESVSLGLAAAYSDKHSDYHDLIIDEGIGTLENSFERRVSDKKFHFMGFKKRNNFNFDAVYAQIVLK